MIRGGGVPGFGRPGSVTRAAIARLPEAMQAEGLLLLREMGERDLCRASGLDRDDVRFLLAGRFQPFRRGGEDITVWRGGGEGGRA